MLHSSWKRFSRTILLLTLLLALFAPSMPATSPDAAAAAPDAQSNAYTIQLRSRTFTPEPGLSAQNRSRLKEGADQKGNTIHAFLQMYAIPSPEKRAELAQQGIRLLTYIPNYAWIASIPEGNLDQIAALPGVRWLGAIEANDKLAPEIREKDFGSWHYDEGQNVVAIVMQLHEDVALEVAESLVLAHGGMVRGYASAINAVTAEMPAGALDVLAADDRVMWIQAPLPALTPNNDGARDALNVNVLHPAPYNPSPTYNLDGSGIDVLVFDSGQVDDHDDFGTRLIHGDSELVSSHSTHVAGTVGGDGNRSAAEGGADWQWRGMAPNVGLISYGFSYDGTDTFLYTNPGDIQTDWDEAKNTHGADLGTASLGTNTAPNGFPCQYEGNYGATSALLDSIVRGSLGEPYITTWANGNERGIQSNPGRCGAQYNTTAPPACAKNPINVGATNSNDNSMTDFSSWGPCDDGRLKPVIVAPGDENNGVRTPYCVTDCISSTVPGNTYGRKAGTSMATPAVAGIIALMLQQYRDTYNRADEFLPSTAKAVLMNTAVDLGNAGPDYQFGYGHVDAEAAVNAIIDGHFREGAISTTGQEDEYLIQVPTGATMLQVSLAWDDADAAAMAAAALVNDLDLTLLDPGGGLHQVWTLDPNNPGNAATTGTDDTNNQEQVTINSPQDGVWRVRVDGTAVPDAPQRYSLAATHRMISLDIADPTQADAAHVGYYGDPEKLLIDLDLRDKFGGPLSTTISSATDLSFSIGGDAPVSTFPSSNVGNHYWVWVTPPTKGSAGCHDLQVTLFGVTTDIEENAVCYGSTAVPPQDMVLTIDKSGSMFFADKMDSTKSAAKYFVTAASIGDMIGTVAFSTTTKLEFPLTTITGTATKDAVNTAIDDLTAFGLTAMGPGMLMASNELTTAGGSGHRRTIVLLSDGRENQVPYWHNISNTVPASITIHTVALGPDGGPDEALLSETAAKFNGNYYRVPTGAGSLRQTNAVNQLSNELSNELADIYRSAAEATYGWERLWDASDEVGFYCQSEEISHTYQVYIEQGLSEVLFAMHWDSVEIALPTMALSRADGTLVNPTDSDVVEHRYVASGDTGHQQYRLSQPQAGYWTVIIQNSQVGCSEYIVMAEARSKNELNLLSPTPGQHIGYCQNVPLLASFLGATQPISGAQVMASLVGPLTGGQVHRMSLFDDGEHGDGQANDGMYGNTYAPCQGRRPLQSDAVGSYQVRVVGSGTNESGEPITRSVNSAYYASASTTSAPDPEPARILLVDDDANTPNVSDAYTTSLNTLGVSYDIWDVMVDGPVVTPTLTPYHTVIWFTGDDLTETIQTDDEAALMGFLNQGGKLFLSSQHYLSDVGNVNNFMKMYLYINTVQNNIGATNIAGVAGNAIGDGLGPYPLSPTAGEADQLNPVTPGGQAAFVNENDTTVAVSFTDGESCSLFSAFPFERLAAGDAEELMDSFLTWPCWDTSIQIDPEQVSAPLWTAGESSEKVNVANSGEGKLTWVVNSGPIHLWSVTDTDGQVPTFLNNLQTTPITDEVQIETCTVSNGVSDCCSGTTCTQEELLNQDVLVIYNDQSFTGSDGLGDMLADFVDVGGTVILANNAIVDGTGGLGGRFMTEDYSPLESNSTADQGGATLDTFDAGHPVMHGVTDTTNVLSHLDVFTTSGDVEIIATWDTGEDFVAIKRHDPAPVPGRVIAINAPLEDGEWGGDLNEVVTNGIQWLSDNIRNLPWLEPVCKFTTPPPVPLAATAIDYTCPPINSGDDWNLTLFLDGSMLMAPLDTSVRAKVFIEHNVSDQGRINIPITGTLQEAVDLTSLSISGEMMGSPGTYTFTTSYQPVSATTPITYLWDDGAITSMTVRTLSMGEHTLMVTATNVSSQVTATHTISITAAEVCTPLMSVDLSTMGSLQTGTPVTFSADLMPDNATAPYSYTIDYDDGSTPITDATNMEPIKLTHTYDMSGTYTVEIGVWNCGMMTPVTTTHTITITSLEVCTALTGVDLSTITSTIQMPSPVRFRADLMPNNATAPYSYTINYDDSSTPTTGASNTEPFTLTHTYDMSGTYSVEIGVWNCDMTSPITDTLDIRIVEGPGVEFNIYLPLVMKNIPD